MQCGASINENEKRKKKKEKKRKLEDGVAQRAPRNTGGLSRSRVRSLTIPVPSVEVYDEEGEKGVYRNGSVKDRIEMFSFSAFSFLFRI